VDPAKRDALAESIKIGTETPITVRRINRAVRCEGKSFWELVAGNRLAPCKKRGIGKIDAFAFEGDCVAAERGEIGEKSASAIKRRRKPKPVVVRKPASEKSDFASGRRNAKRTKDARAWSKKRNRR
jgi:hypothetical protein